MTLIGCFRITLVDKGFYDCCCGAIGAITREFTEIKKLFSEIQWKNLIKK